MVLAESTRIVTPKGEDPIKIFLAGTLNFVKKYPSHFSLSNRGGLSSGVKYPGGELKYQERLHIHNKIYTKTFKHYYFSLDLSDLEDFYGTYCKGNIRAWENGRYLLEPKFHVEFRDKGSVRMWPRFFSSRANLLFTGYGNAEINPEENLENILECFKLKKFVEEKVEERK